MSRLAGLGFVLISLCLASGSVAAATVNGGDSYGVTGSDPTQHASPPPAQPPAGHEAQPAPKSREAEAESDLPKIQKGESVDSQIVKWESYLRDHPGVFSWKAHNELRHLYGGRDESKSLAHSDIILEHSLTDDYILKILSGWQIDKDNQKAISNLLYWTKAYPQVKFVRAACLLTIADLYAASEEITLAEDYYQQVRQLQDEELWRYRALAEARLEVLKKTSAKPAQPGKP